MTELSFSPIFGISVKVPDAKGRKPLNLINHEGLIQELKV